MSRRRGRKPLLYQATIRLLRGMAGAILIIGLMTAWVLHVSQERSAWREIANATEYFSKNIKDREKRWTEAAARYQGRLEYARLLDDPAADWARLKDYLAGHRRDEDFPALLVTDLDGRVKFASGLADEAVPAAFAIRPDPLGWHYERHGRVLYRYYVLPLSLGAEGMGHLVLLRPMDQTLLGQLATPGTRLFLRRHGQVIATSLTEPGQDAHLRAGAGLLEYGGLRYVQDTIGWDDGHPESPELVIHREMAGFFDYWEVALGVAVAVAALFLSLWAAMGLWVYRTTQRIALAGEASRRFTEAGGPSPEIEALLAQACRDSDDEINEVAKSLGSLTATVAQRDAERDAYEATLRENEAKLREITSVLADGVYVLDPKGEVTFVNHEAERLLGWSAADLLGRNGHEIFHYKRPDGSPIAIESCPVHRTIRTGQAYRSHNDWLVHKDGTILPVSIVSSPIIRDGAVQGSVAAFHDITPRLEAERALRESEEKFRLISTSAMDAILIINPDEAIAYWNPAAEKMFGYTADEVLGKNLHALLTPLHHREDAHRGFERFRQGGQGGVIGRTVEMSALRKCGEEFPIELSVSTLTIDNQRHALGMIRDISERKRAEEQIRQLAYYDTLTELPNRRLLADRLNQALAQAKRYRRSLAVMFLDLDRFKTVNDTLGHDAGDELLKQVASRLISCVRSGDTVSRQGGDEFVIILAEISQASDATVVAEKILDLLHRPFAVLGHTLEITVSIGIAIYPVDGDDDAQELMKKADMAMYSAKEAGRNDYHFFVPGSAVGQ